jgi:1-phosphofructokinase family hexose kinase
VILTVTLNPMLDKTIHVTSIRKGEIERASSMEMIVGGKGVNVSRQLHRWGQPTLATGFLGGEIGSLLDRLLEGEGIPHDFVHIKSMTREGLTFLDAGKVMTCVFEPPAKPTREEADTLVEHAVALSARCQWVVCSGSSPGAEADDVFRRIIAGAAAHGVRSVVDSYGEVFRRAVQSMPTLVKMNRDEFAGNYGRKLIGEREMAAAAEDLVARGATWAIITDGSRPLYAASAANVWRITPPPITSVNPTGSGDTVVAGVLHGLAAGWSFDRALACGVSAGALNASMWAVASVPFEDVRSLMSAVRVEKAQE